MMSFEQCQWCNQDCYANELVYSELHGCLVCARCRADQCPTHGEIQAKKRDNAKKTAWNNGNGYS